MLRELVDKFNGTDLAVYWFKRKYPEEKIVFISSATFLETIKMPPLNYSFRRLLQRMGIIVITRNLVVLKNNIISFIAALQLIIFVTALFAYYANRDVTFLLLAIVTSIFILKRLPYKKEIYRKDIDDMKLTSVRGISSTYSQLTIYLKNKTIHIATVQNLPKEILYTF
jgi:hypothetical protein